ncbi:FRG domain-containing protein [Schlesneria paludicola]|uniref:FRG domain-containing protein n=1 Tax=Schlesneria paludicola TaxID=360056 RepID=UPI00029AC858|nr:FRG domain-containing protein [Schlesneria paludicola]
MSFTGLCKNGSEPPAFEKNDVHRLDDPQYHRSTLRKLPMTFGYWNYYDDDFDWTGKSSFVSPDLELTRSLLLRGGLLENDVEDHIDSGYLCFEGFDIVIDRYYGGPLASVDGRCRFRPDLFSKIDRAPQSRAKVFVAKSIDDVRRIVDDFATRCGDDPLLRGQTQNHVLERKINNPFFTLNGIGEISLLPSIWRRMLSKSRQCFLEFTNLSLFEWSSVFYSQFDIQDIERRHKCLHEKGEWVTSISDMEDCSDPVLRQFGKYRARLSFGHNYNLAPVLNTLLQHYGLYSPELDLTKSIDVALFFATNRFRRNGANCFYDFVGTNSRRSVIYLFRERFGEMQIHDSTEEVIAAFNPLRPIRQKCVVSHSSTFAMNLPADFLQAVIVLDFDLTDPIGILTTEQLFPTSSEDLFLSALKKHPYASPYVTEFPSEM